MRSSAAFLALALFATTPALAAKATTAVKARPAATTRVTKAKAAARLVPAKKAKIAATPTLASETTIATAAAPAAQAKPATATAAAQPAAEATKEPATTTATTTPATPPSAAPAVATTLTDEQRGERAAELVKASLKGWTSAHTEVIVRPAIVPFNGDAKNPITGRGPVQVFVTQKHETKGFISRLRDKLNPFSKQEYLVHVGDDGNAQILERLSLAPQRRIARFFATKLPIGALLSDFAKSGKLGEGVFTAIGATGALTVAPWLSGAMYMRVAQVFLAGINSQRQARTTALNDTVAWAKAADKSSGAYPSFMETYRAYQAKLESVQPGARPIGLGDFASALSINQL